MVNDIFVPFSLSTFCPFLYFFLSFSLLLFLFSLLECNALSLSLSLYFSHLLFLYLLPVLLFHYTSSTFHVLSYLPPTWLRQRISILFLAPTFLPTQLPPYKSYFYAYLLYPKICVSLSLSNSKMLLVMTTEKLFQRAEIFQKRTFKSHHQKVDPSFTPVPFVNNDSNQMW